MKHDLRRQRGKKILTQEMEQLPGAAALARNFLRPDYVEQTCGSLTNLPRVFAELDRQQNIEEPRCGSATGPALDPMNLTDVVIASLPRVDRQLVRVSMATRILAAASSRAPRIALGSD